jgi:ABC-type lipoprotein release transport system permease subunit
VAPLPVALATTLTFAPRGTSAGRFVRPALVGAAVGVLGVVGTMTIDRGLNDTFAHPDRAGVTWDATVIPRPDDRTTTGVDRARLDSIRAVPVVADAGAVSRIVTDVNGAGVPVFAVEADGGSIALASTSGRPPRADDEAAIGPETARQLGVRVGDTVTVGSLGRKVRIVGEALFPTDVHAGFDEGLWVTSGGFASIEPPRAVDDPEGPDLAIAVRFRSGADPRAAMEAVASAEGDSIAGIGPVEVPPELINLRNVRTLPRVLAVFLALLAAGAVAHVLGATVRHRRRDFATLRAMGMTPRATRTILSLQGAAIAVVGLVVGLPLGLAAGRIGWRLVTARVPLRFVGPLPLAALLVLVPTAVIIANLLAVWPGRRLSRLRPAEALRTE